MLVGYSITIESLKINNSKVDGPRFNGIQMPPPIVQKRQSFNPFDDIIKDSEQPFEDEDEGFDDF